MTPLSALAAVLTILGDILGVLSLFAIGWMLLVIGHGMGF